MPRRRPKVTTLALTWAPKRVPVTTVAVPRLQGLLQAQQVTGIMLAVAVAAQHNLVAVPVSVDEAGLHGRADAHVVGQGQHHGAGLARDRGGVVAGAVIDDEQVDTGQLLPSAHDHLANAGRLVQRRDDQQRFGPCALVHAPPGLPAPDSDRVGRVRQPGVHPGTSLGTPV